jgi:hypothetical protein
MTKCETYSPDNGVLIQKYVVNLYVEKETFMEYIAIYVCSRGCIVTIYCILRIRSYKQYYVLAGRAN